MKIRGHGHALHLYLNSLAKTVWRLSCQGCGTGERAVTGCSSKLKAKSSIWALVYIQQTAELVAATTLDVQHFQNRNCHVVSWLPPWIQCAFVSSWVNGTWSLIKKHPHCYFNIALLDTQMKHVELCGQAGEFAWLGNLPCHTQNDDNVNMPNKFLKKLQQTWLIKSMTFSLIKSSIT